MAKEIRMSMSSDQRLPGLIGAKYSPTSSQGTIRDQGDFSNKKSCFGTFGWPNGACYEGEFVDNVRQGQGKQTWPDGSFYEGEFLNDMRHGQGKHSWANGEVYCGEFFRERRHGKGTYTWPEGASYTGSFYLDLKHGYGTFLHANGNLFKGLFKQDERFGPGILTYRTDGAQDVGLWYRDRLVRLCTSAPAVFTMRDHPETDYSPDEHITYVELKDEDNRVDIISDIISPPEPFAYTVNAKLREKSKEIFSNNGNLHSGSLSFDLKSYHEALRLGFSDRKESAKLGSSIEGAMSRGKSSGALEVTGENSVSSPDNTAITPDNTAITLDNTAITPDNTVNTDNLPERSNSLSPLNERVSESNKLGQRSESVNLDQRSEGGNFIQASESEKQLDQDKENEKEKDLLIRAWNATPSSIAMQKHVMRYSAYSMACDSSLFFSRLFFGCDRAGFAPQAAVELDSQKLLSEASDGALERVTALLDSGRVDANVSDCAGHTGLIGAAVNTHTDIINSLLDHGADVNKMNDEGLTALAACCVLFYPVPSSVRPNAAIDSRLPLYIKSIAPSFAVSSLPKSVRDKNKSVTTKKNLKVDQHERNMLDKKIEQYKEQYRRMSDGSEDLGLVRQDNSLVKSGEGIEEEQTLGKLKIKLVDRINVEEALKDDTDDIQAPISDSSIAKKRTSNKSQQQREMNGRRSKSGKRSGDKENSKTELEEEFVTSEASMKGYGIEVSNKVINRCATLLSRNEVMVERERTSSSKSGTLGTVRALALDKSRQKALRATINLLLKRGANPNSTTAPVPVLLMAIRAADVDVVRLLLMKGASTAVQLPQKHKNLAAIHLASGLEGEDGMAITQLLLQSLTDPNVRALPDDSYLNKTFMSEWCNDEIPQELEEISGGRTALHIACARTGEHKNAAEVVRLLLEHHANPNVLCDGYSPLALAIASGNIAAVDYLLAHGADPNLTLTHGACSALCVAVSTDYEHNYPTVDDRKQVIEKLLAAGGNLLAPVPIGARRHNGTVVDYAHHLYNLDARISRRPYHALSPEERQTYNNRQEMLAYLASLVRGFSRQSSAKFRKRSSSGKKHGKGSKAGSSSPERETDEEQESGSRRSSCYECGRSVGVKLTPCGHCKSVSYCSKACKVKSWSARHKDECSKLSASRREKFDSERDEEVISSRKGERNGKRTRTDDREKPFDRKDKKGDRSQSRGSRNRSKSLSKSKSRRRDGSADSTGYSSEEDVDKSRKSRREGKEIGNKRERSDRQRSKSKGRETSRSRDRLRDNGKSSKDRLRDKRKSSIDRMGDKRGSNRERSKENRKSSRSRKEERIRGDEEKVKDRERRQKSRYSEAKKGGGRRDSNNGKKYENSDDEDYQPTVKGIIADDLRARGPYKGNVKGRAREDYNSEEEEEEITYTDNYSYV